REDTDIFRFFRSCRCREHYCIAVTYKYRTARLLSHLSVLYNKRAAAPLSFKHLFSLFIRNLFSLLSFGTYNYHIIFAVKYIYKKVAGFRALAGVACLWEVLIVTRTALRDYEIRSLSLRRRCVTMKSAHCHYDGTT